MRGVTAIFLGAMLAALFLILVAAMVWQEARKRPTGEPAVYSLTDAAQFVLAHLPSEMRSVGYDDVLRVLEWQVHYLQQSVRGIDVGHAEVVVGATPDAVAYIRRQALAIQGMDYPVEDVEAILAGQGAYLAGIGAIGEPVLPVEGRS